MWKNYAEKFYGAAFRALPASRRALVFKHMMLHPNLPLAYVRVPKAACSTVIARLLGSVNAAEGTRELHSSNRLITFDQREFGKRLREVSVGPSQLFTLVRNPFSRLLSAYREKIELDLDGPRYRRELDIPADADIGFEAFVERTVERTPMELNPHFRPQALTTRADLVAYDRIFRLEQMGEALTWLDEILPTSSSAKVVAPHATHANERVLSSYTPRLTRMVADYFADDFRLFGYLPDPLQMAKLEATSQQGNVALADFTMGPVIAADARLRAYAPSLLRRHR